MKRKLPPLLYVTDEGRRVYEFSAVINKRKIIEIHIDPHYEEEHEQQEEQGKVFEKEIKELIGIALRHEERGMVKCECWSCEKVRKKEGKFELELKDKQNKVECSQCGRMVKELDEEHGICKRCVSQYES
ncbi:hypothetical protein C1645_837842 [Glomus cerebriforme]|uniref:Uncharacterized protein n=1 Tax=Glomus cerebriforme TaxID=658196 RepID=A0A397SAB5_9GLOM|nr:hypothetical protein C1645_837842 [Glomus cerebriforme]